MSFVSMTGQLHGVRFVPRPVGPSSMELPPCVEFYVGEAHIVLTATEAEELTEALGSVLAGSALVAVDRAVA